MNHTYSSSSAGLPIQRGRRLAAYRRKDRSRCTDRCCDRKNCKAERADPTEDRERTIAKKLESEYHFLLSYGCKSVNPVHEKIYILFI